MSDNVSITVGSGPTKVAAREVPFSGDTAQMQVVGLATLAGNDDAKTATEVSPDAPLPVAGYGDLIETLEAIRMFLQSLSRSVGLQTVDAGGRQRMVLDAFSIINNVASLSTMSNQVNMGGIAANEQVPSLMRLGADTLRRNITVT